MYYPKEKAKDKNKYKVGTIKGNDLLLNRSGKVNKGECPQLGTKIHKSKRDYSRQKNKRIARDAYLEK